MLASEREIIDKIVINGVFSWQRFLDELVYYLDDNKEPSRLKSIHNITDFVLKILLDAETEYIRGRDSEDHIQLTYTYKHVLIQRMCIVLEKAIFSAACVESMGLHPDWGTPQQVKLFEQFESAGFLSYMYHRSYDSGMKPITLINQGISSVNHLWKQRTIFHYLNDVLAIGFASEDIVFRTDRKPKSLWQYIMSTDTKTYQSIIDSKADAILKNAQNVLVNAIKNIKNDLRRTPDDDPTISEEYIEELTYRYVKPDEIECYNYISIIGTFENYKQAFKLSVMLQYITGTKEPQTLDWLMKPFEVYKLTIRDWFRALINYINYNEDV